MKQSRKLKLERPDARARILEAADALVAERGAGNVSVEAVAARAGLSKGGVLYHFRTKAELLSALVGSHIDQSRLAVEQHMARSAGRPNDLAEALVEAYRQEKACATPPPSGILAAIAAHPELLDPLRAHHDETMSRLRRDSGDPDLAAIAFLAIEGMKAMNLFGFDVIDPQQEEAILNRMASLLSAEGTSER